LKCEKLDVWKKSARLSADVYKYLKNLKDFGFKDQITRSALSIASNIAEGIEKESLNEQVRFLEIAKGSTAEFVTQVYIGIDIEYIDRKLGFEWIESSNHILGMITNLQKNIKEKNAKCS
jgi:four helix bundle protein